MDLNKLNKKLILMAGIEAFIGSWREETKEGFDQMADALGIFIIKVREVQAILLSISPFLCLSDTFIKVNKYITSIYGTNLNASVYIFRLNIMS